MNKSTEMLDVELQESKSFSEYMDKNMDEFIMTEDAAEYLSDIIEKNKISQGSICKKIGMKPSQIHCILKEATKINRDGLLRICCVLALDNKVMSADDINRVLKLAGCKELYVKDPKDAAIKFAISHDYNCDKLENMLYDEGIDWTLIHGKNT